MFSARANKVRGVIENTTSNLINNTSGGTIVVINGQAAVADYELIGKLLELQVSASLKGHPRHASVAPSTSFEKLSSSALALAIPAIRGRIMYNCTMTEANNTSGGLIVIINKASESCRSCARPEAESPSEHAHAK